MKASKYNIVEKYGDILLAYNTYTGKLVYLVWNSEIYNMLIGKAALDFTDDKVYKKLLEFGFIIENETDEDKLVELKKFDYIFDNSLKLEIIPTLLCNFRCPYCYEEHGGQLMDDIVCNSIKQFFSKHIRNYSNVEILWFGGEPLLAKNIILDINSFVKKISEKCNKIFFSSITTNGYLLDEKTFNELYEVGVKSYYITFDGTKKFHDKIRFTKNGKGSYNVILNNLKNISNKSGFFKINIRCNLTNDNINSMDDFISNMNESFLNDKRFKVFFRPVGNWGGETVKSLNSKLLNGNYNIYKALFTSDMQKSIIDFGFQFLWSENNNLCSANQRNYFVINYNGDVLKCTKYLNNEKNKIGKISKNGNLIIDKTKIAKWILPKTKDISNCLQCKSYANCFSIQCPIEGHEFCECTEDSLKEQLKLRYLYDINHFIKI